MTFAAIHTHLEKRRKRHASTVPNEGADHDDATEPDNR
jgi:hypothetical protein